MAIGTYILGRCFKLAVNAICAEHEDSRFWQDLCSVLSSLMMTRKSAPHHTLRIMYSAE
jgi:hypothetical protein